MSLQNKLPVIPNFEYHWPTQEIYDKYPAINWFVNFETNMVWILASHYSTALTITYKDDVTIFSIINRDSNNRCIEADGTLASSLHREYSNFIADKILLT